MTARIGFLLRMALGLAALVAIAMAVAALQAARSGIDIAAIDIDGTPATVHRPSDSTAPLPSIVIAHGFAGSQQLMQSFALAFAANGYNAVTFDFAGHGRNAAPLTGDITDETGATRTLMAETASVAAFARGLGDGRLAVLGHSMASDIVIRLAQQETDIDATIAVSMFSPVVTATTPPNLLVIVGEWEGMLKTEALRAVGLATAPDLAAPEITYGDPAAGTGRRATFSPNVEHASVLFSRHSLREAVGWADETFGIDRAAPLAVPSRGPWIALLLGGSVVLAFALAPLLPIVSAKRLGAGLGWRRLWLPLLVPMLATPLILRVLPTDFLPVLVGDYLAAHFAVYGLITMACLWLRERQGLPGWRPASLAALGVATLAVVGFGFLALVWPIDLYVTSFVPGAQRVPLLFAMFAGTLLFFLSDEWLTRGEGAARGAALASKLAFVVSLAIAVALDFERLFFLVIIVPVIVLFLIVYGLISAFAYRRTGHPFVGGIASAVAFAWAIGVTFPMLAG